MVRTVRMVSVCDNKGESTAVTLQIDDDLSSLLHTCERTAEQSARELIVLELYRQHRISSGKAAQLLGTGKIDFIQRASVLGIAYIDMTPEELQQEFEDAGSLTIESSL